VNLERDLADEKTRKQLTPGNITGIIEATIKCDRPLVVINVCQSSSGGTSLTGMGRMGRKIFKCRGNQFHWHTLVRAE
jgi:hypothetical protein